MTHNPTSLLMNAIEKQLDAIRDASPAPARAVTPEAQRWVDAAKWPKSDYHTYCADNGLCPKCRAQDLTERVVDGWKHEQCNACGEIV
jgi:hypothetical protein